MLEDREVIDYLMDVGRVLGRLDALEERAAAMRDELEAIAMPVEIEVRYARRPVHLQPEAGPGLVKCRCGRLVSCLWSMEGEAAVCSECITRRRRERQAEREEMMKEGKQCQGH